MRRIHLAAGDRILSTFENSDIGREPGTTYVDLRHSLPYADRSIDVALISHALALLQDRELVIREVYRVLKPGGWFRIDDNPKRFFFEAPDPDFDRCVHRFEVMRWLWMAGFQIVTTMDPSLTLIPEAPLVVRQILEAKTWHESMTIEARK